MTTAPAAAHQPIHEHSVPWFWPLAGAIELGEAGMRLFQNNLRYMATAAEMASPPPSECATPNRILLDLDTMRLRDFSRSGHQPAQTPVLIDAPYAGHSSTIADYARGQSLVVTLQANGLAQAGSRNWPMNCR